jgi:hypothetical protein
MVSKGDSCTEDLAKVLQTTHRSFFSALNHKLFMGEKSSSLGCGQLVNIVGRDVGVCFSPDCVDPRLKLKGTASCSEVDTLTLVSQDSQSIARHAINYSASLKFLKLAIWPISGVEAHRRQFQTQLANLRWKPRGKVFRMCTLLDTDSSEVGVRNGKLILLLHL